MNAPDLGVITPSNTGLVVVKLEAESEAKQEQAPAKPAKAKKAAGKKS